jgi:hypothetical protein
MVRARAGHHLAPRSLSTGRNVFEELGDGYALLAFGAKDEAVAAFAESASTRKLPLKIIRDRLDGGREDYAAPMVLVRPDQYVVWAGEAAASSADTIMRRASGQAH